MIYNETGAGGARAGGLAQAPAFGIGHTAYNIQKARRGVLEKVVIKWIRAVTARRPFAANRVLYVDTLNGLWNEHDLVSFGAATALAEAYNANL